MNPFLVTIAEGLVPGLMIAGMLLIILPWVDKESEWRPVPIIFVVTLTLQYLFWRVTSTLPSSDNLLDFSVGVAFLAVEILAMVGSLISYVTLSKTHSRSDESTQNASWLIKKSKKPLVDVFICTYNEDRDILERTMLGATAMDYDNFRVWVLDDGKRDWLKQLAAEIGCGYLTRNDNKHAKAGNINNALRHVDGLADKPDFISILDADFVPSKRFLLRAMPLFKDGNTGIVQTPQHFINPDPIQANLQVGNAWPDEQRYFFDTFMASKDAWNTAFCCGTSSVIRMDALRKAGGFPTEAVTEDYLLSIRLKRFGFNTVYLNEKLSLGLAPEGLGEYITQRSRWCLGLVQIIRGKDGPFHLTNGLDIRYRISLIESLLYWLGSFLFRFCAILVPILYLLFDIHAVDVSLREGLIYFLPYYLAQIMVMAWLSGRRVMPVMTDVSQLLVAREVLTAITVGFLFPKNQKFKVTAKGGDRTKKFVEWNALAFFGVLATLTIAGILFAFGSGKGLQDSSAVALYWGWYNLFVLLVAMAVCVELPRTRRHERFPTNEMIEIDIDGTLSRLRLADISVGGLRVIYPDYAATDARIKVNIQGQWLPATYVRSTEDGFAMKLEPSANARSVMVRNVYSGRYGHAAQTVSARKVVGRVLARLAA